MIIHAAQERARVKSNFENSMDENGRLFQCKHTDHIKGKQARVFMKRQKWTKPTTAAAMMNQPISLSACIPAMPCAHHAIQVMHLYS